MALPAIVQPQKDDKPTISALLAKSSMVVPDAGGVSWQQGDPRERRAAHGSVRPWKAGGCLSLSGKTEVPRGAGHYSTVDAGADKPLGVPLCAGRNRSKQNGEDERNRPGSDEVSVHRIAPDCRLSAQ